MEEAQRRISEEEFSAWKNDPVTKIIIARMNNTVEFIKQQWYEGKYRENTGGADGTTKHEDAWWNGFANGIHEFLRVELYREVPVPEEGATKGLKK